MFNVQFQPREVADLFTEKTGIPLRENRYTDMRVIDGSTLGRFVNLLYGPYDVADDDVRLFISYTAHKDAPGPYLQILVQDCEGDFLNSTAQGAERYKLGVIHCAS